jgi:hypothetical protein
MKRKLLRSSIVALILLLVLAVPILASYSATITVTESAGNSYVNLPIIDAMGISGMVTSGFISSTGLDTRVKYGNTELPHMLADDKLLFVSDITANSTKQFTFSTGNSALEDYPTIVGVGGYITTPDNADLEPGDSFDLEIIAYLQNTGIVFNKLDCLRLDYNATTDVLTLTVGTYASPDYTLTASSVATGLHAIELNISHTSGEDSLFLRPTGAGDYETFANEFPDGTAHWSIVNDNSAVGTNYLASGDDYLDRCNGADLYSFTDPSISFAAIIPHIYGVVNYPYNTWGLIMKTTGSPEWRSLATDPYFMGGGGDSSTWFIDEDYLSPIYTNPITGLAWDSNDLANTQFGFYFNRYSGSIIIVGFAIELVNAAYQPTLNLYIDSVLKDSEDITSLIPDNSNDWIWYPDPYFNYIKLETGN